MTKDKNPDLEQHFHNLREMLPEMYKTGDKLPRNISDKLYAMLKSSLGVIEAVYLQAPEYFSAVKVETYAGIVEDLKKLGINYRGNEDLLAKAASQLIMKTKLPMERAGIRKQEDDDEKKVG